MIIEKEMKLFGYWDNMLYGELTDSFEELSKIHNSIDKQQVIKHIENLDFAVTSLPTSDMFTGERLQAGQYIDGEFAFPLDFLHYYKNYDIGIPLEYEEYLKTILK
ncbi:hypothetical protein [Ruminococcus bovis]|uniref:Uncharacterized protein n=1 Tax=Ruminococcus bovis TaxID=2564099 RepID=A0A4P8XZC5_9FIRM|nr:hypothetical protein [Ruminococcus bovis]QCT06228.1 hypothetical protein E5Z56_02080 [Ruminococcus bovis]